MEITSQHSTLSGNSHPLTVLLILVVEDDSDDAQFLCDAFKEVASSAQVACFSRAADAFHYLEGNDSKALPTLIIIDHQLPYTSGLEFLQQLDQNPLYSPVAKVVYTNALNPRLRKDSIAAGARLCLQKSSSFEGIRNDARQMLALLQEQS